MTDKIDVSGLSLTVRHLGTGDKSREVKEYRDAAGDLVLRETVRENGFVRSELFNPDGSRVVIDEDTGDLRAWTSKRVEYDASGNVVSRAKLQDNGILRDETRHDDGSVTVVKEDSHDTRNWHTETTQIDPDGNLVSITTVMDDGTIIVESFTPPPPPPLPETFGATLRGVERGDQSGIEVAFAGDVDGDGHDDLLIGAPSADGGGENEAGETYLVYGGQDMTGQIELSTLGSDGGLAGVVITGEDENDRSGLALSSAGDVNGDGLDDILIGVADHAPGGQVSAGQSYILFGDEDLSGPIDLSQVGSEGGPDGIIMAGIAPHDQSGISVAVVGDLNGDGLDDIVIGASGADAHGEENAGETYVIFGSASLGGPIDLATLGTDAGAAGLVISGIDVGDASGESVASAGDVNGDGYQDILIGAPDADPNRDSRAGETYVVYGGPELSGPVDLATLGLAGGAAGVILNGFVGSGFAVASAGDVNGDGFDDILTSSPTASASGDSFLAGHTYLVYGSDDLTGPVNLEDLNSETGAPGATFVGADPRDTAGRSIASAGDVNGDGFDDILISANGADPDGRNGAGEAYLIFGGQDLTGEFDLDTVGQEDGPAGLILSGIDPSDAIGMMSVAGAGDVNNDGFDDILIGSQGADPRADPTAGETYLVYGGPDILDRLDFADGMIDGVAELANLGLNPEDFIV